MIEIIKTNFELFIDIINQGGLAMWVLFFLNLLLWYNLGQRSFVLKRGTLRSIRRLIEKHEKYEKQGKPRNPKTLLDNAIIDVFKADSEAKRIGKKSRNFITDALSPYITIIKKYSVIIKIIVVIAPLIGLLGTVTGMIETFSALQTGSMFSQGDSIAGGISKALYTTELGLLVAVPGLVIGRILDKKEFQFALELDQLTDIICTREVRK